MHPEILWELNAQRGREMQARALQARLARTARRATRAARRGRRQLDQADGVVLPAIPDYVDGSFHIEPAEGKAAREAGRVPAAHHAA
jgi:hypothetical protein